MSWRRSWCARCHCSESAHPKKCELPARRAHRESPAVFSESRGEKINHQANRGLGGAAARIAIGIDLDDVEADELALGGYLLHQLVDLGEVEAARLVRSRAGCKRRVHGIDIKRDI